VPLSERESPGFSPWGGGQKCRFYIREGSRLAILALPEAETLEVFAAGDTTGSCRGDVAVDELVDVLGPGARTITPSAIFAALHP